MVFVYLTKLFFSILDDIRRLEILSASNEIIDNTNETEDQYSWCTVFRFSVWNIPCRRAFTQQPIKWLHSGKRDKSTNRSIFPPPRIAPSHCFITEQKTRCLWNIFPKISLLNQIRRPKILENRSTRRFYHRSREIICISRGTKGKNHPLFLSFPFFLCSQAWKPFRKQRNSLALPNCEYFRSTIPVSVHSLSTMRRYVE